jgi:hypothetical protein
VVKVQSVYALRNGVGKGGRIELMYLPGSGWKEQISIGRAV